ncbi:LEPR-XLL domain-containing protein [Rhizobium hidalgonense]|nr:LEPR-XLL domain-containing protein [Rhizobium hidalgonense]
MPRRRAVDPARFSGLLHNFKRVLLSADPLTTPRQRRGRAP